MNISTSSCMERGTSDKVISSAVYTNLIANVYTEDSYGLDGWQRVQPRTPLQLAY